MIINVWGDETMGDPIMEINEKGIVYINIEEGLKRVMHNKTLYVKLLHKLKADTHFTDLTAALQAKDYENARTAAHTIKGIAANLSLTDYSPRRCNWKGTLKTVSYRMTRLKLLPAVMRKPSSVLIKSLSNMGNPGSL